MKLRTMHKQSKIFVAGHRGLVGSAIVRRLQKDGYENIITRTRQEVDLMDQRAVEKFFQENVLLDQNLNHRYQFQYSGGNLNNGEVQELLGAIQVLIDEAATLLGDLNGDQNLNVLDIIILVDMTLGGTDIDLNGDINADGGINVLDIVLLVNLILEN